MAARVVFVFLPADGDCKMSRISRDAVAQRVACRDGERQYRTHPPLFQASITHLPAISDT